MYGAAQHKMSSHMSTETDTQTDRDRDTDTDTGILTYQQLQEKNRLYNIQLIPVIQHDDNDDLIHSLYTYSSCNITHLALHDITILTQHPYNRLQSIDMSYNHLGMDSSS